MRTLSNSESNCVSGGNDTIIKKVAKACDGQPDSATVTVSVTASASAGIGDLGGRDVTITKEAEVNCGDFREAQAKARQSGG